MTTTNHTLETANPNKALWEKGDFTRIAEAMRDSGEALVASLGIDEHLRVLDLGSGDGTTAVPAARLGAQVLGVDIAGNLVAAPVPQVGAVHEYLPALRRQQPEQGLEKSGLAAPIRPQQAQHLARVER